MRRQSWIAGAAALTACLVAGLATGVQAGQWIAHNAGLRNLTVVGVTVAPSQPGTIYIQCRSLGVYKSTDGGASWSKTATFNADNGPGFDHLLHDGPAVHPTNPDVVWAASNGKVYKSVNGGGTWALSSTGTTVNGCDEVRGVVVDPNNPDHLFAGTIAAGCDGGVFESTNAGASWTNIAGSNVAGSGVGNDAWPIALDASDVNRLYAGSPHNSVYRSITAGQSWLNTPPVAGDHSTYEVVINPQSPSQVWCNEVGGTWVSDNHGATWTRRTDLFNNQDLQVLRFAPSNPSIAYATVDNTIWRSDDSGANFAERADILGGPRCLAVDPADPDVVYVGTWGLGMVKSTDGGQTFAEINSGLPLTQLITANQAFGDPLEPGSMYCILGGNVVYRLDVSGTEWQYHAVAPDDFIQYERHRPNRWFASAGGLWRSLDSGLTWDEIYTSGVDANVTSVWLDPRRCGRLLVFDRNGGRVLASENGGDTFTQLGTLGASETSFTGIAGDPFDPDLILISASPPYHEAGQNGYVWRSTDRGQTWTHVRDGMFHGDWRIGRGYWRINANAMRQEQTCCCGYHVNLDHQTFADGVFECRIRILASTNDEMNRWAGFTVRTETRDSNYFTSGWLVYMRRSGVVGLHNNIDGTVINVAQTPNVTNTSQYHTIRLETAGNVLTLYADGNIVGSYTDINDRYNGPGYFALETCAAQADFDDLNIQAETSLTDGFNAGFVFAGYWGRDVVADPHNPGRFAMSTQWGGLWHSSDHGASWQLISSPAEQGYLHYRPVFSLLSSGSLYVPVGLSFTWRLKNYYNNGAAVQQIGQTFSYSSVTITEDPFVAQRLYCTPYSMGVMVYDDDDLIAEPAPPIPTRLDFDLDGDIDLSDYGRLQACYTAPGVPQLDPACAPAMIDDDIDPADRQRFLECMSGAAVPPDPACDCDAW